MKSNQPFQPEHLFISII